MKELLRKNAWTLAMVAFLSLFYASVALNTRAYHRLALETQAAPTGAEAVIAAGTPAAPSAAAPTASALTPQRMTPEEIRAREEAFRGRIVKDPAAFGLVGLLGILLLSAGLALDFTFGWRALRGRPALAGGYVHAPVPWGVKPVFDVFLLLLTVEALFVAAESVLFQTLGVQPESDVLLMTNSLLRDAVVGGFLIWLVTAHWKTPLAGIGLGFKDFGLNVKRGLLAYVAVVPALLCILLGTVAVANFFSYEPAPQPVVEIYLRQEQSSMVVLFTFFVAVIGPMLEELYFRGFAYNALRTRYGMMAGALISSAVFSVLHANLVALIPIFFLGLFLAYLYEKTGSLVPGMTAHIAHNLIMVALTLFFKSHST